MRNCAAINLSLSTSIFASTTPLAAYSATTFSSGERELLAHGRTVRPEIEDHQRRHRRMDDLFLQPLDRLALSLCQAYGCHGRRRSFKCLTGGPYGRVKGMLKEAQGKPGMNWANSTMAKAIYTSENIGHYRLGFEHYCHFTSPIRRYPDVLVHRVLDQCLRSDISIDKKMEVKSRHCSDRERAAMECERAANKYKQVEYMQNFLGEEFEGVISGVAAFGFWVETVEHKCEGLVSIASLLDYDDFRVVEGDYSIAGMRSGRKFRMGDDFRIKVVAANLSKRQLDYEWVITASMHQEQKGNLETTAPLFRRNWIKGVV